MAAVYELMRPPRIQGAAPVAFADLRSIDPILPGDVLEYDGIVYQVASRFHHAGNGPTVTKTQLMLKEVGKLAKEPDKPGAPPPKGLIIPGGR